MHLDEPSWWYTPPEQPTPVARLLRPVSDLIATLAERRLITASPYHARLPVICVGNFTVGGTGKTPMTRAIVRLLAASGAQPVVLSRGYGGSLAGPVIVDPARHTSHQVGDEPLLMAAHGPVVIARNRAEGARLIEATPGFASVIVMDDGLQNPSLKKDLTLAIVDAERGIGNGRVLPAGPLRARLEFQLGLVDAVVVNGTESAKPDGVLGLMRHCFTGPVLSAHPEPDGDVAWLKNAPVVAYAAIANPQRFFGLLERLGANLVATLPFPDHRQFSARDCEHLLGEAESRGARLVTTEKDLARLRGHAGPRADLLQASRALPIRLALDERDDLRLTSLLEAALRRKGS